MDLWDGDTTTMPSVNITEEKNNYKVEMAVPGLKREDFNVDVDNNVVTISCEKESKTKEGKEDSNYSRREYNYSCFSRSFSVPENADVNHIDAKYTDGILRLSIPKTETKKSLTQKSKSRLAESL